VVGSAILWIVVVFSTVHSTGAPRPTQDAVAKADTDARDEPSKRSAQRIPEEPPKHLKPAPAKATTRKAEKDIDLTPASRDQISLAILDVLLDSRDNPDRYRPARMRTGHNPTAIYQLSRIKELPRLELLAEQLGLCRPGEFASSTVKAIVSRICVKYAINQQAAYRLPLSQVLVFLQQQLEVRS
jgi:hypothetical protein